MHLRATNDHADFAASATEFDLQSELTIEISGVSQQLCWIPAGDFSMGADPADPLSTEDERPAHRVEISRGFYLFDTAVTQRLWWAVMGQNPSFFRSPSRPVECVNFADVSAFLARANYLNPQLRLSLPSEAQWEYACRAGSKNATWLGPLHVQALNMAHLLEDIAWYSGNAAHAFKSHEGVDSSLWEQCEHYGDRAGTHPVGLKQPNPWGLYDMIGNVWEWCADDMRRYAEQALVDPVGGDNPEFRCARGGSWRDGPAKQRASYRDQIKRDYSNNFVGFRCLVEFC